MRSAILVGALVISCTLGTSCATRTAYHSVIDHYGLEILLRSEKPLFGKAVEKGYDQPAIISVPRLEAILRGIEIDTRRSESSAIRERQSAIRPELIPDIAEGLSQALAEADSDQQVVVLALRKQRQKGIFDRKYLTSFLAWTDEGQLYIELSRIEWKWEPKSKTERLPQPQPGKIVMPFEVVPDEVYIAAGRQTVRVDWRSDAFGLEPEEPAPVARSAPPPVGTTTSEPATTTGEGDDPLGGLGAADYRALAELEEARQAGALDDAEYQRRRSAILDGD